MDDFFVGYVGYFVVEFEFFEDEIIEGGGCFVDVELLVGFKFYVENYVGIGFCFFVGVIDVCCFFV